MACTINKTAVDARKNEPGAMRRTLRGRGEVPEKTGKKPKKRAGSRLIKF